MEQVIQQQDSVSVEVTRSEATKDLPARYGWKINITVYAMDQTIGHYQTDLARSLVASVDQHLREKYGEQS